MSHQESPNQPQANPPAETKTVVRPSVRSATKPKKPWLWNVVLLDDDQHSYDYVIRMMMDLFGHTSDRAIQLAKTVDTQGRAVCLTTHKEHAELKCEQIGGFGADPIMAKESKGPMKSVLEPAEFGGDDADEQKS